MKHVVLFCHIEKCAGTSLVQKLSDEMPFESVDVLTRDNVVTRADIRKTKFIYPNARVIAGHSINPSTFGDFKAVFGAIKTFTVVREPYARIVSNYLHDRTRGVWDGTLAEFASVDWKQNYMLRYLGNGNPDNGLAGYNAIDYKITVKNIGRSFPFLVKNLELPISFDLEKKNSFEQNKSQLPDDIFVENGVKIGRYSISQSDYNLLTQLNARDIDFYNMALEDEENWIAKERDSFSYDQSPTPKNTGKLKPTLGHYYRNLVYKPFLLRRVGPHRLSRNAKSPIMTSRDNAF